MGLIGIDEVGRGCWAGPLLVVAARKISDLPSGLDDSKKISKKKRQKLFTNIELSCQIGQGWVFPNEIDNFGLTESMRIGVERALADINATTDEQIIIDGNINYCDTKFVNAVAIIKADSLHKIVSAASVYAKVLRDKYMSDLDEKYSVYEFEKHVGYGTKLHAKLLAINGVSDMHRLSFAPMKTML